MKKKIKLLRPTAPRGTVPSVPTIAAQPVEAPQCFHSQAARPSLRTHTAGQREYFMQRTCVSQRHKRIEENSQHCR